MSKHAFLSPSGAGAWLKCTLKPWLEKDFPDSSSPAADEGTAAHEVASWCLESGGNASDRLGDMIQVGDDFWEVTDEMAGAVQQYVDNVRAVLAEHPDAEFMVEQRLHIGWITGEDDATGTGDFVCFIPSTKTLRCEDYKHGYRFVDAKDNAQLRTYASAALRQFSTVFDIERVVTKIHQPRIGNFSEEELTLEELREWEIGVMETARKILAGPDGLEATPGEYQCSFCRAKGACPTLKETALAVVASDDFTDLDARIALLTNHDLAAIAPKLELIHDWCNGVRAEMERRILAGQHVEGWKVVQGKKGNRAWADVQRVEREIELLGLEDKAYSRKLLTPTQLEKAVGKTDAWTALKELVTQPEGKAAVVPITDKRPALSLTCDFEPIQE